MVTGDTARQHPRLGRSSSSWTLTGSSVGRLNSVSMTVGYSPALIRPARRSPQHQQSASHMPQVEQEAETSQPSVLVVSAAGMPAFLHSPELRRLASALPTRNSACAMGRLKPNRRLVEAWLQAAVNHTQQPSQHFAALPVKKQAKRLRRALNSVPLCQHRSHVDGVEVTIEQSVPPAHCPAQAPCVNLLSLTRTARSTVWECLHPIDVLATHAYHRSSSSHEHNTLTNTPAPVASRLPGGCRSCWRSSGVLVAMLAQHNDRQRAPPHLLAIVYGQQAAGLQTTGTAEHQWRR